MRYPSNIREEELKNKVATDFFNKYNCDDIIKDIDFAVKAGLKPAPTGQYLIWAEAKKSPSFPTPIYRMFSTRTTSTGT